MPTEKDTEPTTLDTQEDSSDSTDVGPSAGVSYALLHEAASLTNFENLDDPNSVESQVARGRGRGRVISSVTPKGNNDDRDGSDPAEYRLSVEEGRIKTESGYVVRFVTGQHTHLGPFDVKAIDELRDYPAPSQIIENLTPRILGHLKQHGYVQIRGAYSPDEKRFYGVQMGWEDESDVDPWDRLMDVINQVSTTPAAVDYVFVTEGPDRWGVEEVAKSRGIEEASVRGNVRAIGNELDR